MNVTASLIAQLVVFLIFVWFTARFVWPPLKRALDERAARVASAMDAAERGRAEMTNASRRAQSELAAARKDAQKLLADYDRRAQTIVDDARRIAATEAERIVASARLEADQMLDRARTQLRAQVAEIAVVGAANILIGEIDAKEHARLLTQLKDELKE